MKDSNLCIETRPEIRKGCIWDITLTISLKTLSKYNINQIYFENEKALKKEGYYLTLKVRSKLIKKELPLSKVAIIDDSHPCFEAKTGQINLKVKFTQRPRSVFHKHADVMILVVSLRNIESNEIIAIKEHDLIFRGGTGSIHSAESRNKLNLSSFCLSKPTVCLNNTDSVQDVLVSKRVSNQSTKPEDDQDEIHHLLENQNNVIDTIFEQSTFKNDFYNFQELSDLEETINLENWAKEMGIETYQNEYLTIYPKNNKRFQPSTSQIVVDQKEPNLDQNFFQSLFFQSIKYLSLQELQNSIQSSPVPIFVKDSNGVYVVANSAFFNFLFFEPDSVLSHNYKDLLNIQESEIINQSDLQLIKSEGNPLIFELKIKGHEYKFMKVFTNLRDSQQKYFIGALI